MAKTKATKVTKAKPAKKPVAKAKPATKAKAKPAKKPSARPERARPRASRRASDIKPSTSMKPAAKPPSDAFMALVEVFTERPGVTRARMMGCEGLRLAGKYFAMEWRGELVVKLPRDKVESNVAAGHGTPFDPGMGRPMKEWLTVPPGHGDWRNLAEQAFDFVTAAL